MPKLVMFNGFAMGHETKGIFTAYVCELLKVQLQLRFGGCNGSHTVDYKQWHHDFTHFGSGTFSGAKTLLISMVIDLFAFRQELRELREMGVDNTILESIRIHPNCLSITPYHTAISRFREKIRAINGQKKGTVGLGVGEAILDSQSHPEWAIRASDFGNELLLRAKLEHIREAKLQESVNLLAREEFAEFPEELLEEDQILRDPKNTDYAINVMSWFHEQGMIIDSNQVSPLLQAAGDVVVEGSHGILLYQYYGFAPHVSPVDPTGSKLLKQLRKVYPPEDIIRIGVLRSYMHRHGAGPLVTQDDEFGDSLDPDRGDEDSWLGPFRIGPLDFVALKYGRDCVGGPTAYEVLAMSNLDDLDGRDCWPICTAYRFNGKAADLDQFFVIEDGLITAIRVHPNTQDEAHLQHQLRLTELVKQCKPVITQLRPTATQTLQDVLLKRVEAELGIPVALGGFGPELDQHYLLPGWENLFE